MRKLPYLQGLRGTAALVVLLSHYFCAFYPEAIFGTGPIHAGWERFIWSTPLGIVVGARSAVCLFFILSGYVLSLPYFGPEAKTDPQLCGAMVKRPLRLAGLVVATMLISISLSHLHLFFNQPASSLSGSSWLMGPPSSPPGWLHFARDLLIPFESGPSYNNPLWTISYELTGSYLTFVFLLLFRKTWLRWWAYAMVGLTFSHGYYIGFVLGILFADLTANFSPSIGRANRLYLIGPFIAGGVYFSAYPTFIDRAQFKYSWYAHLFELQSDTIYQMAGAFFIFMAVIAAPAIQRLFSSDIIVYIGRISYAMYAIHVLVLTSFSSWLFVALHGHLAYNLDFTVVFASSMLLTLICSHGLTVYFDEKAIRLSDKLAKLWSVNREIGGRD